MKIFLDTSSLFKLYHREADTAALEQMFSTVKITDLFLSEISKIEFTSTVWKKVRTKEITELEAAATLGLFKSDFENTHLLQKIVILLNKQESSFQNMTYKDLEPKIINLLAANFPNHSDLYFYQPLFLLQLNGCNG